MEKIHLKNNSLTAPYTKNHLFTCVNYQRKQVYIYFGRLTQKHDEFLLYISFINMNAKLQTSTSNFKHQPAIKEVEAKGLKAISNTSNYDKFMGKYGLLC